MDEKTNFRFIPTNTIFRNSENILWTEYPNDGRLVDGHAQKNEGSEHHKRQSLMLIFKRVLIIRITFFDIVVFCFLLLFSQHSFAQIPTGLPTGICSGVSYKCDTKTLVRWLQFQNSVGIDLNPKNYISVGSCSVNGNGKNDVNILLALSKFQDDMYFDAKISFHNDLSRYKNTPASEIENVFPRIYQDRNLLANSSTHAYIDYTEFTPYRYWIRHNQESDKLFLLAYFGFINTFLCEFDKAAI